MGRTPMDHDAADRISAAAARDPEGPTAQSGFDERAGAAAGPQRLRRLRGLRRLRAARCQEDRGPVHRHDRRASWPRHREAGDRLPSADKA